MKTFFRLLLCICFLFAPSCKEKPKDAEKERDGDTEMSIETVDESTADSDSTTDCDEFLDEYEEWMDSYLEMMEKYKADPAAFVGTKEWTEMGTKALEWTTKSGQLALDCATDSDYEERMNAIQEKADKKMKELGL